MAPTVNPTTRTTTITSPARSAKLFSSSSGTAGRSMLVGSSMKTSCRRLAQPPVNDRLLHSATHTTITRNAPIIVESSRQSEAKLDRTTDSNDLGPQHFAELLLVYLGPVVQTQVNRPNGCKL